MRKCKKKKVKKWSAEKIAGKHVLKWTGFYRGANAQTRKLCARHNRWTQFATTITAFKEHKRTHRRWIKNIVQHNHNYDDDDGDGDDDNQAVRPLCTSLALSAVCFCENQTDLDNYNFMQISLVLVSSFAPSTHFFPRHNFGGKPSNCYALVDKMSAIPHIDCKFFGITFCIHYYHHYQKNLLHGPFFLAIYPP